MTKKQALLVIVIWLAVLTGLAAFFFWMFTPITTHPVFAVALGLLFGGYFTNRLIGGVLRGLGGVEPGQEAWISVLNVFVAPRRKGGGVRAASPTHAEATPNHKVSNGDPS